MMEEKTARQEVTANATVDEHRSRPHRQSPSHMIPSAKEGRNGPQPWLPGLLLFLVSLVGACKSADEPVGNAIVPTQPPTRRPLLTEIEAACQKSEEWLSQLDVDPVRLRRDLGIKGKKHFVEFLNAYTFLYQMADYEQQQSTYRRRLLELFTCVENPDYHDLSQVTDRQFRQDNLSYLRACVMMDDLGLDTALYRQHIAKIIPRIEADLAHRGVHQHMAFLYLLDRLGFPVAHSFESLYPKTTIASRQSPRELSVLEVYNITHEIFLLTENGTRTFPWHHQQDKKYTESLIPRLLNYAISEGDEDIAAELIVCMHYLGLSQHPTVQAGLEYLLQSQRPDGTWCDRDRVRQQLRSDVPEEVISIRGCLHTLQVALWAFSTASPSQKKNDEIGLPP